MRPGEFRFFLLTVPVAAFLWLLAFVASGAGSGGTYALYAVFYGPLALASYATAVVTGPLLHLAYAVCLDRVGTGAARRAWLLGLGAFHYLAVAAVGLRADPNYGRPFDADFWRFWSGHAGWLVGAVAVFIAWQTVLAQGVWHRR